VPCGAAAAAVWSGVAALRWLFLRLGLRRCWLLSRLMTPLHIPHLLPPHHPHLQRTAAAAAAAQFNHIEQQVFREATKEAEGTLLKALIPCQ
jgi:hypothetical protein